MLVDLAIQIERAHEATLRSDTRVLELAEAYRQAFPLSLPIFATANDGCDPVDRHTVDRVFESHRRLVAFAEALAPQKDNRCIVTIQKSSSGDFAVAIDGKPWAANTTALRRLFCLAILREGVSFRLDSYARLYGNTTSNKAAEFKANCEALLQAGVLFERKQPADGFRSITGIVAGISLASPTRGCGCSSASIIRSRSIIRI